MTPNEQKIWGLVHEWCNQQSFEIPDFNRRQLMERIAGVQNVGWVSVTDALPKPLQTVWLTNLKGWCALGCLVVDSEGSYWAESNGVIYIENGEIVSECVSEDLDVMFWHELPKPPQL